MSVKMQEAVEMSTENEPGAAPQTDEISPEDIASELTIPGWSIVSFEGVAMSGLSYEEASGWMEKLDRQKISGLCIVTDEAAPLAVRPSVTAGVW